MNVCFIMLIFLFSPSKCYFHPSSGPATIPLKVKKKKKHWHYYQFATIFFQADKHTLSYFIRSGCGHTSIQGWEIQGNKHKRTFYRNIVTLTDNPTIDLPRLINTPITTYQHMLWASNIMSHPGKLPNLSVHWSSTCSMTKLKQKKRCLYFERFQKT